MYLQLTRPDYPPYARNWSSHYIFHITNLIFIFTRAMGIWHCHSLWNAGTEAQESCHFSKVSGPRLRGIPRTSTNVAGTSNSTFFLCHLSCLTQLQKMFQNKCQKWVLRNSAWPHSPHSLRPLKVWEENLPRSIVPLPLTSVTVSVHGRCFRNTRTLNQHLYNTPPKTQVRGLDKVEPSGITLP